MRWPSKRSNTASSKLHIDLRAWLIATAAFSIVAAAAQPLDFDYREMEAEIVAARANFEWDWQSRRIDRAYRDSAHARMQESGIGTFPTLLCPVYDSRSASDIRPRRLKTPSPALTPRYFTRTGGRPGAVMSSNSAASLFSSISGPVVQAKCADCHIEGGISGHTRIVFLPLSEPGHESHNLGVFQDFVSSVEGGADTILAKIQGVGHGGGIQVPAGSENFASMESFLRLLGGTNTGSGLSPETLFDGVTMASPSRTLWRAALIFAGRTPTQQEINAVSGGTAASLRRTIRGLMKGPEFHEFLLRASNDRLLTDRALYDDVLDNADPQFVGYVNKYWDLVHDAWARGYDRWRDDPIFRKWRDAVYYGVARAPLELIAYIAENDRPYTEVVTAPYIMANPASADAYGASTRFADPNNSQEFRPVRIESYYGVDDSMVYERIRNCCVRVINPGNLHVDYPHAGVLNTNVFLHRYPSTATNRNRARARWTYYHFLGVDIEKSASRTTDPVALADRDNPTMKNPACTVCHAVMDPVAGTFQNYGNDGLYRQNRGGMDSLPRLYKRPADGSISLYREGDTWYRDMREPGFDGTLAPDASNSVQWLGKHIVADERFAEATVKFWWSPVLGVDVAEPPEDTRDNDFEGRLLASNAQAAEVKRLAAAFRSGISGGRPYNLRDLLTEIALSPWFRAESVAGLDPIRSAAFRDAGMERLLTPEELVRKTDAIMGYSWGRRLDRHKLENDFTDSYNNYRLLYGGIDSDGITQRNRDVTPLMAAVAQSHALEVSCPVVLREFYMTPDSERLLLDGVDVDVTPISESSGTLGITASSGSSRQTVSASVELSAGTKTLRFGFLNGYSYPLWNRDLLLDKLTVKDSAGVVVDSVELETLPKVRCGGPRGEEFELWWTCPFEVPVSIPSKGTYRVEVVARQDAGGDEPAKLLLFEKQFEVPAQEWDERQIIGTDVSLAAGRQSITLQFENDQTRRAEIHLDRLVIRNENGRTVKQFEFETLADGCGYRRKSRGDVELAPWHTNVCPVEVSIPHSGRYRIVVTASQENAEGSPALLGWFFDANDGGARGEAAIRRKVANLHQKLFGVDVAIDSPDVETAYQLFFKVWNRKQHSDLGDDFFDGARCERGNDHFFFDRFLDGVTTIDDQGNSRIDWDRFNGLLRHQIPHKDPHHVARTWVVVLSYLLTDYRYLYL